MLVDNILHPRRKYLGEEHHRVALENQHKTFTQVYRRIKKSQRKEAKYANRSAKTEEFKVGDPVYFRNHQRRSKLEGKWKSHYWIVEKLTPVTFKIRSQLDGSEQKVHADHLRLAKVGDWNIPEPDVSQLPMRPPRKAKFAVSPESTTSEDSESDAEPLFEATRHYRKERDSSSDEDDLPLMELGRS